MPQVAIGITKEPLFNDIPQKILLSRQPFHSTPEIIRLHGPMNDHSWQYELVCLSNRATESCRESHQQLNTIRMNCFRQQIDMILVT